MANPRHSPSESERLRRVQEAEEASHWHAWRATTTTAQLNRQTQQKGA